MTTLQPPEEVLKIAATLRAAGFEAWCVGGAVRDALLGEHHLDWDLATSATPDQVQKLFKRTVPIGIEFGTVGVLDRKSAMHEVTTFRKDVKTDGRHAVVEFGVSLDDDLARRDFTINAIAYDPQSGSIRDPFDGQADLKRRLVRAVGVADQRMKEDRLRALRGIRFAARFRFDLEPATWAAIRDSAPHLTRLSAERVKQELEKTMQQVEAPSVALEWWRESGALATLVPSLVDAPRERFVAVDLLPRTSDTDPKGATLNRLAMLFFGAEPTAAERALKALKFSNAETAWILALCKAHHDVGKAIHSLLSAYNPSLTTRQFDSTSLRRCVATVGRTRTDAFFSLIAAEHLARTCRADESTGNWVVDEKQRAALDAFRAEAVAIAFRDPIELADLAIDGEDLQGIGVKPGPDVGRILKALLERVVHDPSLNTTVQLLDAAKRLIK